MISVRMLREWQYDFIDQNGEVATRTCPKGLALELDEEVAAAAVAAGAAETASAMSAHFAERVRVHKRFHELLVECDGDAEVAMATLLEEEEARAAAPPLAPAETETAKPDAKPAKGKRQAPAAAEA